MKHDIAAVILADHDLLSQLAEQLLHCTRPAQARPKFRQFSTALGGHLAAVKKVVYPGLKSLGWPELNSEVLVVQARIARLLADALTLKVESAAFGDALRELLDATHHMLGTERHGLVPLFTRHLDSAQQLTLGLEAQRYLAHPGEHDRPASLLRADEWLEEAKLVLGGLPSRPVAHP